MLTAKFPLCGPTPIGLRGLGSYPFVYQSIGLSLTVQPERVVSPGLIVRTLPSPNVPSSKPPFLMRFALSRGRAREQSRSDDGLDGAFHDFPPGTVDAITEREQTGSTPSQVRITTYRLDAASRHQAIRSGRRPSAPSHPLGFSIYRRMSEGARPCQRHLARRPCVEAIETTTDRKMTAHRLVVVGAGFGGLETVHKLAGAPVEITIVDRRNHHLFQPLLYQAATASLAPSEIAWPIRHLFRRRKDVTTLLASVDPSQASSRASPR